MQHKNPLVDFRFARGLTRADAAVLFGLSYSFLAQIESGYTRPTPNLLGRLAEFGVDADVFMAKWYKYVAARRQVVKVRPAVAAEAAE